jgi:hypothetical protein
MMSDRDATISTGYDKLMRSLGENDEADRLAAEHAALAEENERLARLRQADAEALMLLQDEHAALVAATKSTIFVLDEFSLVLSSRGQQKEAYYLLSKLQPLRYALPKEG